MSDDNSENLAIGEVLPDKLKDMRASFLKHNVPEVDRYGDGFLAQAYFAARNSSSGKYSSIAKTLGLDKLTFQYYMEKYPDFVLAVNMGRVDGRKDRIENLESALFARAMGVEVEEYIVEESGDVDSDGNIIAPHRKVKKIKKQIPPDTQAVLEILRRVDPNWNPKTTLDINVNNSLNVEDDVNINVDLRTLSPETLIEILNSNKEEYNLKANKNPDGIPVRFVGANGDRIREYSQMQNKKNNDKRYKHTDDNVVKKKTRIMSKETREKISEALRRRNLEKKNKKQE